MERAPFSGDALLTITDAAQRLGLSAARVRQLADRGDLATMRTARGMRLFLASAVERLVQERASKSEGTDLTA